MNDTPALNGAAPGVEVDSEAVIANLSAQVGQMAQQLAVRDAYIDQLHAALAAVATGEEPVPAVAKAGEGRPPGVDSAGWSTSTG